jgi:DUF4097 and DUF4098 domain-containing protein YvlB
MQKANRILRVLASLSVVLAFASTVQAQSRGATDSFARTLPLRTNGTFTLSNVNGSVYVDGWEKESVEIRASKSSRGNPLDLDRVRIVVDSTPDAVSVNTVYPEDDGVDVQVNYRVRVPYRASLDRVQTVNGSIIVRGIEGMGSLRSVNGNVELFDGAGRFDARTTNGNIRIELRRLFDGSPISIETVNGSVVMALPADANAELDILSWNGDFLSELPLVLQGAQNSRGFRGQLGHGGGSVKVRTVNGGIRVVAARPSV